jgi:hypothetical protein
VLRTARADQPEQHRGTVVRVHESGFAPPLGLRRHPGSAFRTAYLAHLRGLWRQDRQAFLALIDRAAGDTVLTLVDDWADEDHAPRRVLAAALKQIASRECRRVWGRRVRRQPTVLRGYACAGDAGTRVTAPMPRSSSATMSVFRLTPSRSA